MKKLFPLLVAIVVVETASAIIPGFYGFIAPVEAAFAVEGTPAVTQVQASAATVTFNLPASIQAGEQIACYYIGDNPADFLSATGWTGYSSAAGGGERVGVLLRTATGSEGSTQVFDNDDGPASYGGICVRWSGLDSSAPVNSANAQYGDNVSQNPYVQPAGVITSVATDSAIVSLWGAKVANRTISSLDADYTLIGSVTGGVTNFNLHLAYETGVSQNSAISTTMSSARDWCWGFFEMQAESGGGGNLLLRRRRVAANDDYSEQNDNDALMASGF